MNDFTFYFRLGWQHIISLDAADHLLFILVLSAIYLFKSWKQVLVLVTSFTLGHSLTLALSVYDLVRVNDKLVEILIPVTIMVTAVFNMLQKNYEPGSLKLNYFLALFFGLIHGMGFANTIRFMLAKSQHIGIPLFGFNVGLEVGQVSVVAIILFAAYILVNKLNLAQKAWVWTLSVCSFCFAGYILVERWIG